MAPKVYGYFISVFNMDGRSHGGEGWMDNETKRMETEIITTNVETNCMCTQDIHIELDQMISSSELERNYKSGRKYFFK